MVVTGVPTPRVPPLFPKDWEGVSLPDSPVTAARRALGGEKHDRNGRLGIGGMYSTFIRNYYCWLGSLPKVNIMLGSGK